MTIEDVLQFMTNQQKDALLKMECHRVLGTMAIAPFDLPEGYVAGVSSAGIDFGISPEGRVST